MAVMLREATPRQLARRRGPGLGGVILGIVALAVAAALVVVLGLLSGLLQIGNPFSAQTIDRTPPTVLKRLESLSSYRGASANFEVNVDLEKRHRYVPAFISGERTVFLAVGSVDAVVDFDDIDASRVVQADGGDSVVVTLPHARTLDAVVDPRRATWRRETGVCSTVSARRSPTARPASNPCTASRRRRWTRRREHGRRGPRRAQHHQDAEAPARRSRVRAGHRALHRCRDERREARSGHGGVASGALRRATPRPDRSGR